MEWRRPWARSPSRTLRAVPTYSCGSDVIFPPLPGSCSIVSGICDNMSPESSGRTKWGRRG
eukprot:439677-Pyramimonas_sp.AAC.1